MATRPTFTLVTDTAGENRGSSRSRVLILSTLRVRGATFGYPIKIRDLSASGMRCSVDVDLFVGARVEIDLRNLGWIPGQVAWAATGQIGVRFACQIDPERVRMAVTGSYQPIPSASTQLRRV